VSLTEIATLLPLYSRFVKGEMVRTVRMASVMALLLAAAMLGGCGSSSGSGDDESLTKAEYVRKGNAICGKWQQARGVLFSKFTKELQPPVTQAEREKAILKILEPYETATKDLAGLPLPKGDEKKAEAVVSAMEEAGSQAKKNPSVLLRSSTVFEKPNELVEDYGLKECKA
jgi:hypothetical protein